MSIEVSIRKDFGEFVLDVNFQEKSRRIGILGASGSGKSMTLKCIAGIERPDSGKIVLDNRILYDSASKVNLKPQLRRVGYLFQNYALFPTMTVEENIAAGLRGSREEKRSRVSEMVRKFAITGLEKRLPSQLSGGQQQRVALARIMAYRPDVILLDEPFSALDWYLKDHMQEELMELLADYEGTVIMVSHSRDEIYRFSDRLLILDHGTVINHGDTKEIFENPETVAAAKLTGCKNFSRAVRIDDHTVEATDWGVTLHTKKVLPQQFEWLGFRAHQFEPIWGERQENCLRFRLSSRADLQFEKNFYLKPEREKYTPDAVLTWFVQRSCWPALEERGMPDYVKFREQDLMYLM